MGCNVSDKQGNLLSSMRRTSADGRTMPRILYVFKFDKITPRLWKTYRSKIEIDNIKYKFNMLACVDNALNTVHNCVNEHIFANITYKGSASVLWSRTKHNLIRFALNIHILFNITSCMFCFYPYSAPFIIVRTCSALFALNISVFCRTEPLQSPNNHFGMKKNVHFYARNGDCAARDGEVID